MTNAELDDLVAGALDARPISARSITKLLIRAGVKVDHVAVLFSLGRLLDARRAVSIEKDGWRMFFDPTCTPKVEDIDAFSGLV